MAKGHHRRRESDYRTPNGLYPVTGHRHSSSSNMKLNLSVPSSIIPSPRSESDDYYYGEDLRPNFTVRHGDSNSPPPPRGCVCNNRAVDIFTNSRSGSESPSWLMRGEDCDAETSTRTSGRHHYDELEQYEDQYGRYPPRSTLEKLNIPPFKSDNVVLRPIKLKNGAIAYIPVWTDDNAKPKGQACIPFWQSVKDTSSSLADWMGSLATGRKQDSPKPNTARPHRQKRQVTCPDCEREEILRRRELEASQRHMRSDADHSPAGKRQDAGGCQEFLTSSAVNTSVALCVSTIFTKPVAIIATALSVTFNCIEKSCKYAVGGHFDEEVYEEVFYRNADQQGSLMENRDQLGGRRSERWQQQQSAYDTRPIRMTKPETTVYFQ